MIRLGIRGFNPKLKRAAERLESLCTPEGEPKQAAIEMRDLGEVEFAALLHRREQAAEIALGVLGLFRAALQEFQEKSHWAGA